MTVPGKARVVHIIADLDVGGAEQVLLQLLRTLEGAPANHAVISLSSIGAIGQRIQAIGVEVEAVGLRGGGVRGALGGLARLWRAVRRHRQSVVQTWMYHADLIGGLVARVNGMRVVWGVHTGALPPRPGVVMRFGLRAAAGLSRVVPTCIVCCSETSRDVQLELGYDPRRMIVIPNGFDPVDEMPVDARREVRARLGIPADAPVVTRVARFHPQKDHASMAAAMVRVWEKLPDSHLVLVGEGMDSGNQDLHRLFGPAASRPELHHLGQLDPEDVLSVLIASDVAVSSSAFGEGLPLVVGEAIGAGVPVVVTDVGDVRSLVESPGQVVPPRDPGALADAIIQTLGLSTEERESRTQTARARLASHFGLDAMARRYEAVYEQVAR
jgi:glycosyltransferase involved in cell wall biosynthesis